MSCKDSVKKLCPGRTPFLTARCLAGQRDKVDKKCLAAVKAFFFDAFKSKNLMKTIIASFPVPADKVLPACEADNIKLCAKVQPTTPSKP